MVSKAILLPARRRPDIYVRNSQCARCRRAALSVSHMPDGNWSIVPVLLALAGLPPLIYWCGVRMAAELRRAMNEAWAPYIPSPRRSGESGTAPASIHPAVLDAGRRIARELRGKDG